MKKKINIILSIILSICLSILGLNIYYDTLNCSENDIIFYIFAVVMCIFGIICCVGNIFEQIIFNNNEK